MPRKSRDHKNHSSNDHASTSGDANSVATPSSVYMPSSIALSRDNMSDLSGISGDRSSSNQVPGQILDPRSLLRPWNQAYSLSKTPPECNPRENRQRHASRSETHNKNPRIWVAENDVVEIFDDLESSLGLDRFKIRKHDRIPIMVLLMDPSKQTYELMQIWVDRANDSIRDLVQVLQHKLPNQWKQAYDGLFQVRGNRFTQLINIIKLTKYEIQPNEILIAKPWAMAAKVTITVAGSAIRHLTRIGVIESDGNNRKYTQQQRNDYAPLLLSRLAQDRAYFPEGILDHHHATQFITFSPPFEFLNNDIYDDMEHASNDSVALSGYAASQESTGRRHDAHSSSFASENSNTKRDKLDKSPEKSKPRGVRRATNSIQTKDQKQQPLDFYHNSDTSSTTCGGGCFSKLNCFRNRSSKGKTRNSDDPMRHISMATLTEEEEKRWLAYSMKPIDEDQSLANASVVSMSAPLLR